MKIEKYEKKVQVNCFDANKTLQNNNKKDV